MAKISREFQFDSDRDISATGFTSPILVDQDDGYTFQTTFFDLESGASGTVTLQTSINGTEFADYPNAGQNFTDTTTTLIWEMAHKRHKWARLAFTAPASGTGTSESTYYGERFEE